MKTILILEDDVIFSRSIGNWLKKKGMATEHAATLSAARKALSAREFDLVLADLRLPDGNSTSLLEWMNERFYATPFLIMTNYGQVENAVEAMQLSSVQAAERLVQQLARTHPKTITQLAQKDTGSSANRHMRQILRIYNGASREMSLPLKN